MAIWKGCVEWSSERHGDGTRLVGPVAAQMPVGLDFIARPFAIRPMNAFVCVKLGGISKSMLAPASFQTPYALAAFSRISTATG